MRWRWRWWRPSVRLRRTLAPVQRLGSLRGGHVRASGGAGHARFDFQRRRSPARPARHVRSLQRRCFGRGAICGHLDCDDVEKSTRLTAPASEAPVTVPGKRVAAIQTPATGALSGWLVLGTSFVRTDASFANPVVVLAGVGAAALVARTPSQMLLRGHSSATVRVQRFDPAAGTLDSTALFTLPGGISATTGATAQDATNAYMIAYDASFAPSLYRLAFTVSTSGTASLVAVDKTATGTATAPALGAAFPSGTSLTPIAALGDKVY